MTKEVTSAVGVKTTDRRFTFRMGVIGRADGRDAEGRFTLSFPALGDREEEFVNGIDTVDEPLQEAAAPEVIKEHGSDGH